MLLLFTGFALGFAVWHYIWHMYTTMRKVKYTLVIALSLLGIWATAQTNTVSRPHLSAGAKQYLWLLDNRATDKPYVYPQYVYRTNAQGQLYLSTLIKVLPGFTGQAIEDMGAHINTRAGSIWTVQVPVERFRDFVTISGIQYIEVDQPTYQQMDSARVATRVDSVHSGYGLPQPYTGKDVVVGIIDAGYDYTHPALYDTAYNAYRVKRVWEEKNTTGTAPAGFNYGTEYTDSASIHARQYDIYDGTHGTHVVGIAAGSGYGGDANPARYRGMAYNSDVVLVAIYPTLSYWLGTGMADMLDGVNYVFNYAQSVGKPAVANLSWGCPLGPRDGNSLFSQGMDNLTGIGKVFVLSAGNNAQNKVHIQKAFTPTDISLNTFVTFANGLPSATNRVDVWGDSSETFFMRYSLYNNNTRTDSSALISLDETTHYITLRGSDGDTCFITVTSVSNEYNGKPHMLLDIYSKTANRLCLNVTATSGTVDMWQGYVYLTSGYYGTFTKFTYPWAANGDNIKQVSDMVTTRSAIGVAAYNTKNSFVNINGTTQNFPGTTIGAIASFSSHGPTADERNKPDIAGPGMAVASSVSSFDSSLMAGGTDRSLVCYEFTSPRNGRKYNYALFQGTSMSSPAVSGIVALMLQANPQLSAAQVMDILKQTAITDSYTGTIPATGNTTWGYGKVNAYAAILKSLETTGIYHQPSPLACMLYPNPGNGSYAIQYTAPQVQQLQLTVTDATGRAIINHNWQVAAGNNTLPVDLTTYPAGIYYARLNNAGQSAVIKIIKQ